MGRKGMRGLMFATLFLFATATAWAGGGPAPKNAPNISLTNDATTDSGSKIRIHLSVNAAKAQNARRQAQVASGVKALCTPGDLLYNGGPVMRNPTNYLIFWQPAPPAGGTARSPFPAGYQAAIEKFFQDETPTPFYNIVTQYNDTTASPVPNAQSLGAPSFTDTTTVPPSGCDGSVGAIGATPHCPLTDADIQNEVDVALTANPTWAKPGPNVEYFVYTPSDADECSGPDSNDPTKTDCFAINGGPGPNQIGAYCAYHGDHTNGSSGPYAFQPFTANGNCFTQSSFPNGVNVDTVLGATSHEEIESNTDPFLNAWIDVCGAEIGDKCAYDYGYVAPDGTNIVLNGNRYQIQREWSNDVHGCDKRFGPTPGTSVPGSLAFGEVERGSTAEKDVVIQNNASGDLNILNIRLGGGSDPAYTLLNVPPSAATLHSSESLTVQVQFAPNALAAFGSPTASVIVDTDDPAQTTYTTNVTGTIGIPPTASCAPAVVSTDPNLCTNANASVNAGSSDPDGEAITLTQSPAGPYTLGTTAVTLTVTDTPGLTSSCASTVTVQDHQDPTITCPAAQTVQCMNASGAAVSLNPNVADNCPGVTAACVPPSGSTFGFGTTPVKCTATDGSGNMSMCSTSVTVTDVAPVISSVVASPNVLRPPNKKLDPVKILVTDSSACGLTTTCSITSVTSNSGALAVGSDYVITGPLSLKLKASGNGGHALTYIVGVTCTDTQNGSTTAQTTVQAPL